jgi:hypothetical protein
MRYTPGEDGTAESRLEKRRLRAAGLLSAVDGIRASLAES